MREYVYITLQPFIREPGSCNGLQTSRLGGRREYEIMGRAPTCLFCRQVIIDIYGWADFYFYSKTSLLKQAAAYIAVACFFIRKTPAVKHAGVNSFCLYLSCQQSFYTNNYKHNTAENFRRFRTQGTKSSAEKKSGK